MGIVRTVFNDAIATTDCPKCEAEAGEPCVSRRDDELATLHSARLQAYVNNMGEQEYRRRLQLAQGGLS